MERPGGEVEPCSFPSDFAARSFVRRLTEQGSSLVNAGTVQSSKSSSRSERRDLTQIGVPMWAQEAGIVRAHFMRSGSTPREVPVTRPRTR